MPYRRAHWYVMELAAITAIGFWRDYFAVLPKAIWPWHVHGITASLWILLVALQSWTIADRRLPLHRTLGKASLILFPFFFAGGVGVIHSMAVATTPTDPFYRFWGAPLGSVDTLATVTIGWLFFEALRARRNVQQHARLMLATPLFLLFPALERVLSHYVPGMRMAGPQDFWFFRWDTHITNLIVIAFTLALSAGAAPRPCLRGVRRRHGRAERRVRNGRAVDRVGAAFRSVRTDAGAAGAGGGGRRRRGDQLGGMGRAAAPWPTGAGRDGRMILFPGDGKA